MATAKRRKKRGGKGRKKQPLWRVWFAGLGQRGWLFGLAIGLLAGVLGVVAVQLWSAPDPVEIDITQMPDSTPESPPPTPEPKPATPEPSIAASTDPVPRTTDPIGQLIEAQEAAVAPPAPSDTSEIVASAVEPKVEIEPPAAIEPPTTPAWITHAVPAPPTDGKPMIVIVIDDLGVDRANAERMAQLPGPLTLAFMTYARDVEAQARAAQRRGHEIMLHMPMEPLDPTLDAGPDVLRVDQPAERLRAQIAEDLSRLDFIVGVNNHMGSKFTRDPAGMALVMEGLKARGLFFLDSKTIADSIGSDAARAAGVPALDRDIFLDNDQGAGAIDQMLVALEAVARRQGYAIGIGHPHPATIEALARWLPSLEGKGLVLVPISAIVKKRAGVSG